MFSMTVIHAVVAFLALCQVATAFYPYYAEYKCIHDSKCVSKGSTDSTAAEDGVFTLKLKQKQPLEKPSGTSEANEFNNKRVNNYHIVPAATPTEKFSAGIDQDGTDFSYFAEVHVGSESTPIYLLLDTGSGITWLMGSMCESKPCKAHNTFGPDDSNTYTPVPDSTFGVRYGTGEVTGLLANDTLSIAGLELAMTLGIASSTSESFSNYPMDGILGLSRLQGTTQPSFLQTLTASKSLKSNVFGLCLGRTADGPNTGEINFGAPNTSRYSGSLSYTDVISTSASDWVFEMDSIGFNGKKSNISSGRSLIDSGTSFIFCSADDAREIHSLIPGSSTSGGSDGVYNVPCSTTKPITVTFSGVTYEISSQDWVSPEYNGVCTSNIIGNPVVSEGWLLGDAFLKNVYALFDYDKSRIGLAQRVTSSDSPSGSPASPTGMPDSLSTSVSKFPSSTSALAPGPTTSAPKTGSNSGNTEPAQGTSTAGSPGSGGTDSSDLNSHPTDSPGKGPAETPTSAADPSPTEKSVADRLDVGRFSLSVALLALLALV